MYTLTSLGIYIGFLFGSIGRGPDFDTVSKIWVYEIRRKKIVFDLVPKVFRIRDIMSHNLKFLRDTIDTHSFQFKCWSTITPKNFA